MNSRVDHTSAPSGRVVEPTAYKTMERVLASSTPHGGWRSFVLENSFIPGTLTSGILLCLSAWGYTRNLSTHLLTCPDWVSDCDISRYVRWNAENLSLVQGIVTVIYGIGLSLMTCSVRSTAESVIWPLLTRNAFTINQIETYLAITRGQVFNTSAALHMLHMSHAAAFMVIILLTAVTSLSVAPLVGWTFALSDTSHEFESTYYAGGSVNRIYDEINPSTWTDIDALVEYQTWASGRADEPLPEHRDWIVDRTVLKNYVALQAHALRTTVDIECRGHNVAECDVTGPNTAFFSTGMSATNPNWKAFSGNDKVEIQLPQSYSSLSVWVNDLNSSTPAKSAASLVFLNINGTIEQGSRQEVFGKSLSKGIPFSALECTVRVEIQNKTLVLGRMTRQATSASVLPTLSIGLTPDRSDIGRTSNESQHDFALWLAVAPMLVGPRIGESQPSFVKSDGGLPKSSFSTRLPIVSSHWTIKEIEDFIRVAIGAVALSASRQSSNGYSKPIILIVDAETRKMLPDRVLYLFIPMAIVSAAAVIFMCLSIHLHRQHSIPIMRLAPISEIIKSSQTKYMSKLASKDALQADELSTIGSAKVMYGLARGILAEEVYVAGFGSEAESTHFTNDYDGVMLRHYV